jgi:hypothetical protein
VNELSKLNDLIELNGQRSQLGQNMVQHRASSFCCAETLPALDLENQKRWGVYFTWRNIATELRY